MHLISKIVLLRDNPATPCGHTSLPLGTKDAKTDCAAVVAVLRRRSRQAWAAPRGRVEPGLKNTFIVHQFSSLTLGCSGGGTSRTGPRIARDRRSGENDAGADAVSIASIGAVFLSIVSSLRFFPTYESCIESSATMQLRSTLFLVAGVVPTMGPTPTTATGTTNHIKIVRQIGRRST